MIDSIIHGDCLREMPNISNGSVDMVLVDMPYGATQNKWDSVIPLKPLWTELRRIVRPKGAIVMTAQQPFTTTLIASNKKLFKYTWVWIKETGTGHLNANKYPMKNNEDIVVFCDGLHLYNPQMRAGDAYTRPASKVFSSNYGAHIGLSCVKSGGRYPLTTLHCPRDRGMHPTQKPVALMEYLIKTYTNSGDLVLDFACGSGTTCIAAKNLDRHFIGIELEAKYWKIACSRIKEN